MTTTDIHNWKGIEFSKEFVDFTVTGMLEAKATGSVQTGRMVRSIKMKKIADGFTVYSDRSDFPPTRRGKDRYYTHVYHNRGYPRYPAFPFIFIAFDTVGESDKLVNSTSGFFGIYKALRPSGRRGSGSSNLSGSDRASVTAYLQKAGTKLSIKVPKRLAK